VIFKNKAHRYKKTALKEQKVFGSDGVGFGVGCYIYGGQLHKGEQAERLDCLSYPINCRGGFYSKALNAFFVDNGEIFIYDILNGDEYLSVTRQTYGEAFFIEYFFEGGARVACCTGNYAFICDGKSVEAIQLPHAFTGGAYHFGRFFFCDDTTVYWSGLGGIDDWERGINQSGSIILENLSLGKILRLVVTGDKLVAVRECGFTVIRAFGAPENFKVDNLSAKCRAIEKNSVAVAQSKVFYFCEDGLYCFDTSTVKRVDCAMQFNLKAVKSACGSSNCYYAYGFAEKLNKYTILCVQLDILCAYFINSNTPVLSFGDCLYGHGSAGVYRYAIPQQSAFDCTSGEITFNTVANKVLRYICLPDDSEGTITVKSDLGERIFEAKKCVKINMAGVSFIINFKGKCKALQAVAVAEV